MKPKLLLTTVLLILGFNTYAEPMQKSSAQDSKAKILERYDHLDPQHLVPTKMLERAVLYFHANRGIITNEKYMIVFDVSQHSSKRRLYVIDMKNGDVDSMLVSHGEGSDKNNDGYADRFSDRENTHMTSLGFYLTGEIYRGKYGRSLKLKGLEETNDNAEDRNVVMHGAPYVSEKQNRAGRSWGCPAVDFREARQLFPEISGGSLLYISNKK